MAQIVIRLPSQDYAQTWNRRNGGFKQKNLDENLLRLAGAKHADIWAKGEIYPRNPFTGKHPDFQSVTGLVKFACEGKQGLLGYCESMVNYYMQLSWYNLKLQQEISCLKLSNDSSLSKVEEGKCKVLQLENRILQLQQDSCLMEFVIKQANRESDILKADAKKYKKMVISLQSRLSRLKKTSLGLRERNKSKKPIVRLNPRGGAYSRRIYAMRQVMHMEKNENEIQDLAKVVTTLTTKDERRAMLDAPSNIGLKKSIMEVALEEIGTKIDVEQVQGICDQAGISRQGYRLLFKPFRKALKSIGTNKIIVPRPYSLDKIRMKSNANVLDILGGLHSIDSSPASGTGSSDSSIINLSSKNNVWVDLEKLLQLMVIFYDIHESDVAGQLDICLKLDEMELTHGTKYERVSLTLMNMAFSPDYEKQRQLVKKKRDPRWFSVQSEDHTWWLGLFQVKKENYAVLKWVFEKIGMSNQIQMYNEGGKLHVEGFGFFRVNFHLGADLKTEKAMFNVSSSGAKTCKNCLFCLYTLKDKAKGASKSTLSCDQQKAPDRHLKDDTFDPILPIPLERVHICTLHALVRIVEKMIFHSECFVWNIRDENERKDAIERVEKVLSEAGLHGGCVKLEKDTKRSGNGRSSIPAKVSIGGEKARHFLLNSDKKNGVYEFGRKLVEAERDRTDGAHGEARKRNAWNALSDLNVLLQKQFFTVDDKERFRVVVREFTNAYIKAWGECEVTHYIHIIYAHGPWFAEKYGSLAIWNTQGMEKSHKQAKMAFNRKTQRGGCSLNENSNPLRQMFMWFYRRILRRHEDNLAIRASPQDESTLVEATKKRRREAWKKSDALVKLAQWREKRCRVGSKYCIL